MVGKRATKPTVGQRSSKRETNSGHNIRKQRKKPVFYDSSYWESKKTRKKTNPNAPNLRARTTSSNQPVVKEKETRSTTKNIKKKIVKEKKVEVQEKDTNLIESLPQNKQQLAAIILADLNRKLFAVSHQPS